MTLPTQAAITRAVRAAIRAAHESGYRVASYRVAFVAGVPQVDVTMESAPPPTQGGVNVEEFRTALRRRHATRRP